jgi:hypothetical protein
MRNFGLIKEAINTILAKKYKEKTLKEDSNVKKFFKLIKEDDVIKTQYRCYDNIENYISENEIKDSLVMESNINILRSIKDEISEANQKLVELFNIDLENITESSKIGDAITHLIFLDENVGTLDVIVESKITILESFKNKSTKEKVLNGPVDSNRLMEIAVSKFKERYGDVNELQMKAIKAEILNDDSEKLDIITNLIDECSKEVDDALVVEDYETKEKLFKTKVRLLEMKLNPIENFMDNFNKVTSLLGGFKSK